MKPDVWTAIGKCAGLACGVAATVTAQHVGLDEVGQEVFREAGREFGGAVVNRMHQWRSRHRDDDVLEGTEQSSAPASETGASSTQVTPDPTSGAPTTPRESQDGQRTPHGASGNTTPSAHDRAGSLNTSDPSSPETIDHPHAPDAPDPSLSSETISPDEVEEEDYGYGH